jgi:uncharacterized membrane protein
MIKKLRNLFLQGLGILLPTALSILFLIWIVVSAEVHMAKVAKFAFSLMHVPEKWQLPGMGTCLAVVVLVGVCVLVGLFTRIYTIKKIFSLVDLIMERLPIIKIVHGAISNFAECLDPEKGRQLGRPAKIYRNVTHRGGFRVGFVTREDCSTLLGIKDPGVSMVYFPFALNMGGIPEFVIKGRIQFIEGANPADIFTLIFSAGLSAIKEAVEEKIDLVVEKPRRKLFDFLKKFRKKQE